MKIAIEGAGYTPGEADQLRRDMAAWRKNGRLDRHRERIVGGLVGRGVALEFAERLFEQIKGFGEYGFPESHAASFAVLVYASAWQKTHYPAIFATALLNSLPMGFYAPAQIIADAQEHGIEVRPIDVNFSSWDCTLERDERGDASSKEGARAPLAMRLGLRLVKGLGEKRGRALEEERRARGPFVDVNDCVRRCRLDAKAQRVLVRGGAFDRLGAHRRAAMWNTMGKRLPLLAYTRDDDAFGLTPHDAEEIMMLDYEHTGLSLDDHPMRYLRPRLQHRFGRQKLVSAKDISRAPHGTRVVVAGLVIGRQRPGTADGTCFVTLEDEGGLVNVVVWGRDFERWRTAVVTSSFLVFRGRVERQGIVVHLIADGVAAVTTSMVQKTDAELRAERQLDFPFQARSFH